MKAILHFNRSDILNNQTLYAPDDPNCISEIQFINWWSADHSGYYGKPWGMRELKFITDHPCNGMSLGLTHSKISLNSTRRQLMDAMLKEQFDVNVEEYAMVAVWLTSGGNMTAICDTGEDTVTVLLNGARHGLRMPFNKLTSRSTYTYLETMMPQSAHPYLTRDEYASKSLECALEMKSLYEEDAMFEYEKILKEHRAPRRFFMSEKALLRYYRPILKGANTAEYDDELSYEVRTFRAHLFVRGWIDRYQSELEKRGYSEFSEGFIAEMLGDMRPSMYSTGYIPNQLLKDLLNGASS